MAAFIFLAALWGPEIDVSLVGIARSAVRAREIKSPGARAEAEYHVQLELETLAHTLKSSAVPLAPDAQSPNDAIGFEVAAAITELLRPYDAGVSYCEVGLSFVASSGRYTLYLALSPLGKHAEEAFYHTQTIPMRCGDYEPSSEADADLLRRYREHLARYPHGRFVTRIKRAIALVKGAPHN